MLLPAFRYNERVQRAGPVSVRFRRRVRGAAAICLLAALCAAVPGCFLFKRSDGLAGVPIIVLNPTIRFSRELTNATIGYQNACGKAATYDITGTLTDAINRKTGRVFSALTPDQPGGPRDHPNGTLEIKLGIKQIDLAILGQTKKSYPVTFTLGLDASFFDEHGVALFSQKVQSAGYGDVQVTENSCEVKGLDPAAKEAAELVAEGMARHIGESIRIRDFAEAHASGQPRAMAGAVSTDRVDPGFPLGTAGVMSSPPASEASPQLFGAPAADAATLTFRAIVRDENRDQVLQQEESLTIEIEVKNDGLVEARGVEVAISGTPALTAHLPSTISVGDLQPGEIKRATTSKPIGALKESLRGELVLSLRAASPLTQAPPAKKVAVQFKSGKVEDSDGGGDIDQPPKPVTALKQPKAVVVSVGVGRFRDEQVPMVKYATRDAEVMANYLKSIGSVPHERVRVLVDTHALKQDLVDTFEDWLPKRADPAAVVYVFFSGRALVDGVTGAVSLIPFDGGPSAIGRVYSVRRLQDALARLSIHRAVLMFDVSLDPSPGSDPGTSAAAVWDSGTGGKKEQIMWMVGNRSLQEAHAYERGRHGLFTYHLLKGLQGAADMDRDGTVAAGELCTYAGSRVSHMAREQFSNEQEPVCVPPAGQGALVRMQPLAKGNNPKPAPVVKKPEPSEPTPSSPPATPGVTTGP